MSAGGGCSGRVGDDWKCCSCSFGDALIFYLKKIFFLNLFTYVFAVSGLSYGTQDLHCGAQTD